MGHRIVEPRAALHREVLVNGVAHLVVPLRRQWFTIAFLPFWLIGWAWGWWSAAQQLASRFDLFMAAWLGAWTMGGAFAAGMLAGQFGDERLRVVAGDLEVSTGVGPLRRTWRYRGGAIEHLQSDTPGGLADLAFRGGRPFFLRPRSGAVRFDYGSETVYVASGVDEPEGRAIVDWLKHRLPAGR